MFFDFGLKYFGFESGFGSKEIFTGLGRSWVNEKTFVEFGSGTTRAVQDFKFDHFILDVIMFILAISLMWCISFILCQTGTSSEHLTFCLVKLSICRLRTLWNMRLVDIFMGFKCFCWSLVNSTSFIKFLFHYKKLIGS